MNVFAHPPMVSKFGSHVNVCFQKGNKIVSLSLDDSCGQLERLSRGTVELHVRVSGPERGTRGTWALATRDMERVFGPDVSAELLEWGSATVQSSAENMARAMRWLERTSWGFEAASSAEEIHGHPV
mgnify:CR=1 FL=1|tara:strand:- start:24 stop:404 length:381 start_codon:yes stop_codon:yes gene_type:complete